MFGAETLDHIGIPVQDLDRSEKFYQEILGLNFFARRRNADGSPRHTYVLAGENIIGLNLPGVQIPASPSGAPRYGIAADSEEGFQAAVRKVRESGARCGEIEEHGSGSPFLKSVRVDDPDNNHLEICLRRDGPPGACLSHVIFETADLAQSTRFYTQAVGLRLLAVERGEHLFGFKNRQIVGLKPVAALSDRTRKHGRAVHVAFNVSQEDFDPMVGVMVVVTGALISAVFYWFGMDLVAYAVLAGAVLVDFVVYRRLGDVTVCYRCHSEFRGRYRRTAGVFDLHAADVFEREYERKIGRRS